MDNLEEMQIHRKVHLPRLNQEEREIMSNPITNTEIETVIKNLPKKQKPKNRWLHREILSTIREKLMSIFLKLSQKITEAVTLSNSFYEANITLIPIPGKDNTKRENYRLISLMNIDAKITNKILANRIQKYIKKLTHHDQVGFIPEMQRFFKMCKSINDSSVQFS